MNTVDPLLTDTSINKDRHLELVPASLRLRPFICSSSRWTLLLDGHLHVVPNTKVFVLERVDCNCRLAGFAN